jgi:pyruvate/2-oxoglutarate dehydrogenase complex dihydrolipoamide acyltransferase (E2) component
MQGKSYRTVTFPRSRLATFDIGQVSKKKHYVTALLEIDVTETRKKIKAARKPGGARLSFNGWLLAAIGATIARHGEVAAFRRGRRGLICFDDVDISLVVEKEVAGYKVPLPVLIRKANGKSAQEITAEIEKAKAGGLEKDPVVLQRRTSFAERTYYLLPGVLRRLAWRWMLRCPHFVFARMGNAIVTAVGMMGQVNGWFVQTSVHPISFGIGSITRKPVVSGAEVAIGEVLHLTIRVDHDAVDGAPMARFVAELAANLEAGIGL